MTPPSSSLPDLDAMMDITARFEAAQRDDPALKTAQLDEMLRHVPGKRAILTGRFQGRDAVFRMALDPEDQMPEREWAEMARIWPDMHEGAYRIAEPLHFSSRHGLLVIEAISGTPLMQYIWKLDSEQRQGLMTGPAEWLRQYTKASERIGTARAEAWLNRAEDAAQQQPHKNLRRREARVLRRLRRLAKTADTQPWRYAISHGDFHPNNLLLKDDRLTGIDTGGSASMPIYKDMARFLMHMGRRGLVPSGRARFGVDLEGIEAFTDAFELTAHERDVILPFFIGCEALLRVENPDMKRGRIARAAQMYDLLNPDLGALIAP
ncbi:phosphotransferase [Roseovarius sp. 2305UL8-3]|uniref:phosphotransferase n=1 Tax=Roseovarius conchicola TaxID=3121636 RepID=UPI0035274A34